MSLRANTFTAQGIAPPAFESGTIGQFDLYLLAQSWQPFFCSTGRNWPGCNNPTPYMSSQLTIHGLWPEYNNGRFPSFCAGASLTRSDISQAGASDVAKYWPDVKTGGTSFVNNEWIKHGTCSGLSASKYVSSTLALHIKTGTNPLISSNVGRSVSASSLRAAYGANKVSLICMSGALAEVRTCYDKAFRQIACPTSILNQDNCGKSSMIKIYSF